MDSQSVTADATITHSSRGFDAGRKINGRRRHLLTDALRLVLDVLVTPASTTDRDAARILLPAGKQRFRRLARIWADGGYTGPSSTGRPSNWGWQWRSSVAATTLMALKSCPAAGSSSGPSPGSCGADGWSTTTKGARRPGKPSSGGRWPHS